MGCKIPVEIQDYLDIVDRETYPVCKEQHLFSDMVKRAFADEDIYVDANQLAKYLSFQQYFPYKLFEWEKCILALHCCTYVSGTGLPRFPDLLMLVGRGAGKNGYLSFEDFCLLSNANGIRNYNIDIVATSEDQAITSFNEIREDVLEEHRKVMSKSFKWTKESISSKSTGSELRFRTNNVKTKDGLRPGKVDFDEMHQYENYDNINVFSNALGKKPHPRRTYATTDGYVRGGPLDEFKDRAMRILNGEDADNGLLPFICRLDSEDEAKDPALWPKANPSLPYRGDLRSLMERQWVECQTNPGLYSDFLTKRMNIPVGNRDQEVASWEDITACNREFINLTGRSCVGGVDYARSDDFVAVGLLFRDGDVRYWKSHTFVCTNSRDLSRIKAPIRDWASQGLITMVDDVEVPGRLVTQWFEEQASYFDIRAIAIDSFRYSFLSSEFEKIGYKPKAETRTVKLIRPSDQQLVEPVINSCFINKQIVWGDNRIMNWYTNNTKKSFSAHGNFSYEKIEPKSRKTDGFMAFVSAMTLEAELKNAAVDLGDIGAFVF